MAEVAEVAEVASAAAPGVGSARSDEGEREETTTQPSMVSFKVEGFGDTKLRYFAVEFVGAFMLTLLTNLFRWTEHFQHNDSFKMLNPGPAPTVGLSCHRSSVNASSCAGPILHPLAGSTLPRNYMFSCLVDGLGFICCSMSSPGATILPQFAILYCLVGLKDFKTFLPSILGQYMGVALANFLMYYLLRTAIGFQTTVFMMTPDQVQALVEDLFGLKYPGDDVSNEYAFLYACLSGMMLVFVLTPMLHRCIGLHPLASDAAKGIAIAVFQAGFGLNGLGSMPNPTQWVVTALYLQMFGGYNTWTKHNYYALIVPLWAPVIGVVLGAGLYRVYMSLLHFGKVQMPLLRQDRPGRRRNRARQACCP